MAGLYDILASKFPKVEIICTKDSSEALAIIKKNDVNVVLTDIRMPGMDGFDLLSQIKKVDLIITVVIMTAFGSVEMAVEAVKKGAYDFICKPFDYKNLFQAIKRALEHNCLIKENITLKRRMSDRVSFEDFVGRSAAMLNFYENIRAVAHTNYTVLVRGESGTGKEITAKAIHRQSVRRDANLVMVNCPAIPEQLLESELFGHNKGAFTGADNHHAGLFTEADGGTICLDEIGDVAMSVQVKLLRTLQEGEIRPLGSSSTKKINVRVIAMTNQNLEEKIRKGLFREDLFYRLNVVNVWTPKLDDIKEDIPLLISHFGNMACVEQGVQVKRFKADFIKAMTARSWPGNVRQLQNAIRRAVVFCPGNEVCLENMDHAAGLKKESDSTAHSENFKNSSYKTGKEKVVKEFSQQYINHILRQTNGNVTKAANLSGLSRAALQKIMNRFAISSMVFRNPNE